MDLDKVNRRHSGWDSPFLDAIKNICDSWEETKTSALIGVRDKLIPVLMDDFQGFKTSVEEVTASVVEITRTRIRNGSEGVTKLLQSCDNFNR